MVLSGLLLVALVSLCLGLTLPSAGFLIASLVVCVVAAFLLVRARVCLSAAGLPSKSPLRGPAVATQTVTSSTHPGRAEEPPAAADAGADPATVWVVDGSPDYHAGHDCPALTGQDLVDIPLSQAVEDGFAPCRICRIPPTDEAGATPVTAGAAPARVWVVDGWPGYHRPGCRAVVGQAVVDIALSQAVEDGFVQCGVCAPGSATPARADVLTASSLGTGGPARDARVVAEDDLEDLDEVWVVDGRPAYHRTGCTELADLQAEPIPFGQAVEDGFAPCGTCLSDGALAAAASQLAPPTAEAALGEVWVVDGYAHFHIAGCPSLEGLPGEVLPRAEALELGFASCPTCAEVAEPVESPAFPGGALEGTAPDAFPVEPATVLAEPSGPPALDPPAALAGPTQSVRVVDGFLNYHRDGCTRIASADSVSIPLAQAAEDGFQACAFCDPPVLPTSLPGVAAAGEPGRPDDLLALPPAGLPTAPAGLPLERHADADPEPPTAGAGGAQGIVDTAALVGDEVWVVDGYPEYHARGCGRLVGQDAESIPLEQATEDGFVRCAVCLPAAAGASVPPVGAPPAAGAFAAELLGGGTIRPVGAGPHERAPSAGLDSATSVEASATDGGESLNFLEPPRQVFVADGYPYFHEPGCSELLGLVPHAVPFGQATGDGFQPCPVCLLHGARLASPIAPEPWTVVEPIAVVEPVALAEPGPAPAEAPVVAAVQIAQPEPATVWVVAGRPRFHRSDCVIVKGAAPTELDHQRAVADGFKPCALCNSAAG
jgi:hypothetical protein